MYDKKYYLFVAVIFLGIGLIGGLAIPVSSISAHISGDSSIEEKTGTSPYAGQQTRDIKYLSPEDVEALQKGKGGALGGLAKPAELNSYPGPRHVLDLAEELELQEEQKSKIQALFKEMKAEAQPVGQNFLDIENKIDTLYENGKMTDDRLNRLLNRTGDLYGRLRYVHLKYHFQTKDILTEKQVQKYNQIRGYSSDNPCEDVPEGVDPESHRKHMGCST